MSFIKKQLTSIRTFNAYSYKQAFKELFLFPHDFFIRKGESHPPLNISLFLTLRCNAMCSMCNIKELLNKQKEELSLEKIDSFLKEVAPSKPSIILFGGEPLLRKDFIEILKKVKSYNLSCGIFTNGLLFNEEKIKKILEQKMNYIAFSLQGLKETHDSIVGIKGAYDKMINNIKEFTKHKKRKTKIIIHTTITESNLSDLGKIIELGEKLKVDLIRFGHPTFFTKKEISENKECIRKDFPNEEIDEISYDYDPKEKAEIYYKEISKLIKKYKGRFTMTPDLSLKEIKNWYSSNFKSNRKCMFIYRGTFIYPNGDVVPCESIKYTMGNINQQPFKEIWNSKKYMKFRKVLKKGLLPACTRCCKL